MKQGRKKEAMQIMRAWNGGVGKLARAFNAKFSEKGYGDKGAIMKSYLFTPRKQENVLRTRRRKKEKEK